jgi:hypothetical protein
MIKKNCDSDNRHFVQVFFVKENFDKVFDETLIVTTVKEIFDQKL